MKNIFNLVKNFMNHFSRPLIIIGYTLINLVFNYNLYWHQLIFDQSKIGAVYGEVQVYEWALDKFYQTLISGKNPFGISTSVLYPFGLNFSLLDLGNGLFFPLFRTFLSVHQTLSIIVTVSLIVANIGMYILLRRLNFSKIISFVIGAAYGYMTFLMPRAGHLSYWSIFLFPWFYYFTINILTQKNKFNIFLSSLGMSIIFVLALLVNFYYFTILLISIFSFCIYFFIFKNKLFFNQLKKLWSRFILVGIFILIFLLPWLQSVYEFFIFDLVPKTSGWGGAIEFGSDLFNYFIPSEYGFYVSKYPFLYKPFLFFLKLYTPSARSIFENFTYPGVIILFCYISLIFIYKKFDKTTKNNIKPFLFTSVLFFILTLGPFLHVFGHWTLTLDEGVRIVIPLPYIILHYVPFLNNVRVPGRLIVGFIFCSYIVSAYIINYYLKNKSVRFRQIFFILICLVFFVDHRTINNVNPAPEFHPYKIFNVIKSDKEQVSVMEIPFTVRDGFTYFGSGNDVGLTVGQLLHAKPVIGGYIGRIADYKKNYYKNNPLTGFIGRVIDDNLLANPNIDKDDLKNWKEINIEESKKTIDFLDIKYIIINDDKLYSASLSAILKDLGYNKKIVEKNYSLWESKLKKNEYRDIQVNHISDQLFLGFGWHNLEDSFRWVEKRSDVLFKIKKPGKYKLHFNGASFFSSQYVNIYLNKKKVARVKMSTVMKEYSIPINIRFEPGINTVYFMFEQFHLPSEVYPGDLDNRRLSGKFNRIWLTN